MRGNQFILASDCPESKPPTNNLRLKHRSPSFTWRLASRADDTPLRESVGSNAANSLLKQNKCSSNVNANPGWREGLCCSSHVCSSINSP